jgi:hypothetical protein
MNHATLKMRYFASSLVSHEESSSESPLTENQAVALVVEKLRFPLVEFMGTTGFRALLSRSLMLAKEEDPWLAAARVSADGRLEGFDLPQPMEEPKDRPKGGVVMLAWLLGLLGSFIGELLTMQLVLETWPDLSLDGYFSQGKDHEKNL